jgi:tetratricopeptide (TPR) repeat protein
MIRKDSLGQGLKAHDLFRQVYTFDKLHVNALINATAFALNEQEFRQMAKITLSHSDCDKQTYSALSYISKELDSGNPYWNILYLQGAELSNQKQFGHSAAFMELVLLSGQVPSDKETQVRRGRAQSLRALDSQEEQYRATVLEWYPAEERIALKEALLELDRALAVDPYEAELWNLKAAWCNCLERYGDALGYALKAIELRPSNYAKPYMNKAIAFRGLKQDRDAFASAEEALKQAKSIGSVGDIQSCQSMVNDFAKPFK